MNCPKLSVRVIFIILIFTVPFFSYSQTYGFPGFEETARSLQRYDKSDSLLSFCVRPLYSDLNDSLSTQHNHFNLLPLTWDQQYNSSHPYGWNDGPMIPAKGYQSLLSFGVFLKKGWLSLQLRPELVYAQNSHFSTFPSQHSDSIWKSYYQTVLNLIDAPERFGDKQYLKLFPGQSYVRFNYRKLSLGLSTENLWWGPGVRNSLLMSNNAPGFPHLSLNSSQPLTSSIGSFEWQVISGKLYNSDVLPEDTSRKFDGQQLYVPKKDDERYINGIILTWQPKWTRGLFVGFSRVFYQYLSEVPSSLDGYLPVIGKFFKKKLPNEDEKKRDQMLSFFFRLVLAKEKAELYGEFGRNDHSLDIRDLLDEPEHSRAYILGFAKTFEGKKKNLELFSEITNLQMPSTIRLRAQESWYAHYQVRHGYTNRGQVIGAGVGPGGASQTMGLIWRSGLETIGGSIERVVHNNDFYYNAFTPSQQWQRHWVDMSLNLNKTFLRKQILYDVRLSYIYSLNYQWYHKDASNLSARVSITYLFNQKKN